MNDKQISLVEDKWVRILPDYCSTGIWAKDGSNCSYDELPVSDYLKDKIRQWIKDYDLYADDWKNKQFQTWQHNKKFHNDWGLVIAKEVKRQLPDWTVIFFDTIAAENKPDYRYYYDRESFEYEIK